MNYKKLLLITIVLLLVLQGVSAALKDNDIKLTQSVLDHPGFNSNELMEKDPQGYGYEYIAIDTNEEVTYYYWRTVDNEQENVKQMYGYFTTDTTKTPFYAKVKSRKVRAYYLTLKNRDYIKIPAIMNKDLAKKGNYIVNNNQFSTEKITCVKNGDKLTQDCFAKTKQLFGFCIGEKECYWVYNNKDKLGKLALKPMEQVKETKGLVLDKHKNRYVIVKETPEDLKKYDDGIISYYDIKKLKLTYDISSDELYFDIKGVGIAEEKTDLLKNCVPVIENMGEFLISDAYTPVRYFKAESPFNMNNKLTNFVLTEYSDDKCTKPIAKKEFDIEGSLKKINDKANDLYFTQSYYNFQKEKINFNIKDLDQFDLGVVGNQVEVRVLEITNWDDSNNYLTKIYFAVSPKNTDDSDSLSNSKYKFKEITTNDKVTNLIPQEMILGGIIFKVKDYCELQDYLKEQLKNLKLNAKENNELMTCKKVQEKQVQASEVKKEVTKVEELPYTQTIKQKKIENEKVTFIVTQTVKTGTECGDDSEEDCSEYKAPETCKIVLVDDGLPNVRGTARTDNGVVQGKIVVKDDSGKVIAHNNQKTYVEIPCGKKLEETREENKNLIIFKGKTYRVSFKNVFSTDGVTEKIIKDLSLISDQNSQIIELEGLVDLLISKLSLKDDFVYIIQGAGIGLDFKKSGDYSLFLGSSGLSKVNGMSKNVYSALSGNNIYLNFKEVSNGFSPSATYTVEVTPKSNQNIVTPQLIVYPIEDNSKTKQSIKPADVKKANKLSARGVCGANLKVHEDEVMACGTIIGDYDANRMEQQFLVTVPELKSKKKDETKELQESNVNNQDKIITPVALSGDEFGTITISTNSNVVDLTKSNIVPHINTVSFGINDSLTAADKAIVKGKDNVYYFNYYNENNFDSSVNQNIYLKLKNNYLELYYHGQNIYVYELVSSTKKNLLLKISSRSCVLNKECFTIKNNKGVLNFEFVYNKFVDNKKEDIIKLFPTNVFNEFYNSFYQSEYSKIQKGSHFQIQSQQTLDFSTQLTVYSNNIKEINYKPGLGVCYEFSLADDFTYEQNKHMYPNYLDKSHFNSNIKAKFSFGNKLIGSVEKNNYVYLAFKDVDNQDIGSYLVNGWEFAKYEQYKSFYNELIKNDDNEGSWISYKPDKNDPDAEQKYAYCSEYRCTGIDSGSIRNHYLVIRKKLSSDNFQYCAGPKITKEQIPESISFGIIPEVIPPKPLFPELSQDKKNLLKKERFLYYNLPIPIKVINNNELLKVNGNIHFLNFGETGNIISTGRLLSRPPSSFNPATANVIGTPSTPDSYFSVDVVTKDGDSYKAEVKNGLVKANLKNPSLEMEKIADTSYNDYYEPISQAITTNAIASTSGYKQIQIDLDLNNANSLVFRVNGKEYSVLSMGQGFFDGKDHLEIFKLMSKDVVPVSYDVLQGTSVSLNKDDNRFDIGLGNDYLVFKKVNNYYIAELENKNTVLPGKYVLMTYPEGSFVDYSKELSIMFKVDDKLIAGLSEPNPSLVEPAGSNSNIDYYSLLNNVVSEACASCVSQSPLGCAYKPDYENFKICFAGSEISILSSAKVGGCYDACKSPADASNMNLVWKTIQNVKAQS